MAHETAGRSLYPIAGGAARRRAAPGPDDDSLRVQPGNANTHVTTNMPTILEGGGFKHGQHIAFDMQHNYPLPNLFVSMLQRMGLETDRFASATGTMRGLEMA